MLLSILSTSRKGAGKEGKASKMKAEKRKKKGHSGTKKARKRDAQRKGATKPKEKSWVSCSDGEGRTNQKREANKKVT